MRIDRLDLIAFGPFTATSLDLSSGNHGLHIIQGPNEAGKSSALRGVRQLFFGVKHNSSDGFLHSYPDMRIGASLRHDGETLTVIRRKAKAGKSLFGPDDVTPVDESILSGRFLGGIGDKSFEGMFTLDHVSLSAGGKDTLDAGGDFAQVLFGAGLDLPKLRQYQKSLEKQLDELFKPRGVTQKINGVLKQLETANALVQTASIKGADWIERTSRLDRLKAEKAKVDEEWMRLDRERKRLERILKAHPDVTRRNLLLHAMAELAHVPLLPQDAAETRRTAEDALRAASSNREAAKQDIDRLNAQLAALPSRSAILDEASAIESLKTDLGEERKSAKHRFKLHRDRTAALAEAQVYLRELGRIESSEEADVPVISAKVKVAIRDLAKEGSELQNLLKAESKAIAAEERTIQDKTKSLADLPSPRSGEELRRVLASPAASADFTENLEETAKDSAKLKREIKTLRAKLSGFRDDLEDPSLLPVPDATVIEAFRDRLAGLEAERNRNRDEVREVQNQLRELDDHATSHHEDLDVDEGDLLKARALRETGWRLIKDAWRDDRPNPSAIRDFVGSDPAEDRLGDVFEDTVRSADHVADRLRTDARRLADQAAERANRKRLTGKLADMVARSEIAERGFDDATGEWIKLWDPCGVDPQSPVVMSALAATHAKLVEKVQLLDEKTAQTVSWQDRMDEGVRLIHRALVDLGEAAPATENLAASRVRARTVLDAIQEDHTKRAGLETHRDEARNSLADAQARLVEAQQSLTNWKEAWGKAVSQLGLDADATEHQATATLDAIAKFTSARQKAQEFAGEIAAEEQEAERFRQRVAAMVARLAIDVANPDAEATVAELGRRLESAQKEHTERLGIETQKVQREQALREASAAIVVATRRLADLCRDAGCEEPAELPEVERKSSLRRSYEFEKTEVEARLIPLAAGTALDEFALETSLFDLDALPSQISAIEEAFLTQDQQRQELSAQIGQELAELGVLKETALQAKAEEASADREHLLARLEVDVDRYVHLKLAWAVLRDAIEEFRKQNQAPVLQRAGAMFAALTLGSFQDLRVDLDEKDQPVLVGIRPDGKPSVSVEGMSVGTVDQLYLALKLALLRHYLETHPALPLVVDDLLIQFDDARAVAALTILAEFSKVTQVLFFTHHDHLVDLARKHLASDVLFVHSLGRSRQKALA